MHVAAAEVTGRKMRTSDGKQQHRGPRYRSKGKKSRPRRNGRKRNGKAA